LTVVTDDYEVHRLTREGWRYGVNGWSFDEMEKMPLKNVFNPLAGIRSLKMGSVHVNHGHLISRDEDVEGSMH
jgi:hypothetical protein